MEWNKTTKLHLLCARKWKIRQKKSEDSRAATERWEGAGLAGGKSVIIRKDLARKFDPVTHSTQLVLPFLFRSFFLIWRQQLLLEERACEQSLACSSPFDVQGKNMWMESKHETLSSAFACAVKLTFRQKTLLPPAQWKTLNIYMWACAWKTPFTETCCT